MVTHNVCILTQMSKQQPAGSCCQDLADLLDPRFFKALCDPNRIGILVRLAHCARPCTVTGIAECCPVDISVVSRHLGILRDAGIVASERRGKEVFYTLRYPDLAASLHSIADAMEACCLAEGPTSRRKS